VHRRDARTTTRESLLYGSLKSSSPGAFRSHCPHHRKRASRYHVSGYDASRNRLRWRRSLTCLVESKPNSKMTKTNTIGIMLMASSIIDKKSPRRAWREEHRAMDLRRRTRTKSSSLSLRRLDLSS